MLLLINTIIRRADAMSESSETLHRKPHLDKQLHLTLGVLLVRNPEIQVCMTESSL